MAGKKRRKLFSLGLAPQMDDAPQEAKSYMFRFPVTEGDEFVRDFPTAIEAVRGELEEAGVSKKTMQSVELRISGVFIEITGEKKVLADIEARHKQFRDS